MLMIGSFSLESRIERFCHTFQREECPSELDLLPKASWWWLCNWL